MRSDRTCKAAAPPRSMHRPYCHARLIDTHHHQFETALRSFLADGVLINDGSGSPSGSTTYYEYVLNKFAPMYRPHELTSMSCSVGSELDDGVTTVHDVSHIHHTRAHSDAAIRALFDTGRRAAFGYFESAGKVDRSSIRLGRISARRLASTRQWFSSRTTASST